MRATFVKHSQRRLDESVIAQQGKKIAGRMLGSKRGIVWSARVGSPTFTENGDGYIYQFAINLNRIGKTVPDAIKQRQYDEMLRLGQAAANASSWVCSELQAVQQPNESPSSVEEVVADPLIIVQRTYSTGICTDLGEHFSHIYEREAQIQILHSALMEFVDSEYENRFNAVLFGEPASGKTEILRSFARMVGSEAVLELDATSTTKAGAERILLESAKLPPILICEEIEKTDEASLRWLLAICDQRGEVRKTTHNKGLRHRDVKMLVLATVNDMELFRRVMDGALASRFSHKIFCPRPSKQVLHKILQRDVAKRGGNEAWIIPAVDYCVDTEKTSDPRRVRAVCLSGKDRLLTGEYQTLLQSTMEPK